MVKKNILYYKVQDFLNIKLDELNPEDSITTLGIDSMKLYQLIGLLEENLDIEINISDNLDMKIKNIFKYIDIYKLK